MKKLVIILGILIGTLTSAYAVSINELKGEWVSNPIMQEATEDMPMSSVTKLSYHFIDGSNVVVNNDIVFNLELGDSIGLEMQIGASAKGTYTVSGDCISVYYNTNTVDIKFTEDGIKVFGPDIQPEIEQAVRAEFYKQMLQELPSIKEGIGQEPDVLNNVVIVGNNMTSVMDGTMENSKKRNNLNYETSKNKDWLCLIILAEKGFLLLSLLC